MIRVRTLELRQDSQTGWELVFGIWDAFDFTTPFRTMLADIARALGSDPDTDLILPPANRDEDFVEGSLTNGHAALGIYFEHSLSYLSLRSPDRHLLQQVRETLAPVMRIG